MRLRLVSFSLVLLVAGCVGGLFAQTRKKPVKTTKPGTAEVNNKTRGRRTEQSTKPTPAVETKTSDTAEQNPESKPERTAKPETTASPEIEKPSAPTKTNAGKPDDNGKSEKSKPTTEQTPTISDPLLTLRDQIDAAATPAERNRLRLRLVDELVNTGKKTEALSELRSINETDVFDPQGFYNTGNSFARLGDTEGAVGAYRKAIDQRKGGYSRALNNLGVVLLRAGRWDEAYDSFLSALKLEGFRYAEASYNLGRLYAARGESDLAAREWRRALRLDPDHSAAAAALARIGTEGSVVVDSTRVSESRLRTEAPKAPVHETPVKAVAEKPRKSPSSASPSPRSLVLDPASFDLLQRARGEIEKGKTTEAVDSYKRLLARENGYFAPANLELSFVLLTAKRFDEAFGNLQMVASRDGKRYPISYYHLARVYEAKGDLKQAEVYFSQAVSAFGTQNSQFLLDVSRVREKQGDFNGALEVMERYLSIMQQQGQEPNWSNERVTALREKAARKN